MKNVQFVIANEVKQSHKTLILKEIATAHMRLAMTGSEFFKALFTNKGFWVEKVENAKMQDLTPMRPSRNDK